VPDRQSHRGAHPEDARDFAVEHEGKLRHAVSELSYLLSHGYAETAALTLVGDHHQLTARQRRAVARAACTDTARARRHAGRTYLDRLAGETIAIDGFNCLITLEAMLAGAPVFVGRDGALRDLASVHGTYRRVEETERALWLLGETLLAHGIARVLVRLDRPVCNSGRLRALFASCFASLGLELDAQLDEHVDRTLVSLGLTVASSDSWILGRAPWVDLPAAIASQRAFPLWRLNLLELA
jgi:hypothetical protein